MRCALVLLALAISGCVGDAVRPRFGIPTLDDAGRASDGFVDVSAGEAHTCGLLADGTAYCWGSNEFGQLGSPATGITCRRGDRDIACRPEPVGVLTGLRFRRIAAGGSHTCALGADDDRIYCWGDNLRGALGDPSVRRSDVPVPVASTATFTDVAAGRAHSCGVRGDGVAMCWGSNDMGQVGNGSSIGGFGAPASLTSTLRFAGISAAGDRTCARTLDGLAYCWGSTWVSRVSGADVRRPQTTPARLATTLTFTSVTAGAQTSCGISAANEAWCWEANSTGAIGNGTLAGSLTPSAVAGEHQFVAVSAGAEHTCAVAATGYAWCWGAGGAGELGVSTVFLRSRCGEAGTPCNLRPVQVSGWRQFERISVGQGGHACGLTLAGNIYCWGRGGMGQRGDGRASLAEWSPVRTRPPQNVPVDVTEGTANRSTWR